MSSEQEARRSSPVETGQRAAPSLVSGHPGQHGLLLLGRSLLALATAGFVLRTLDLAMPAFETPDEVFLVAAALLFAGGYLVHIGRRNLRASRSRRR